MKRLRTPAEKINTRLKYQFTFLLLTGLLLPVILAFTVLVSITNQETKQNNLMLTAKTAQQITAQLDGYSQSLSNVSEVFSNDNEMVQLLRENYTGRHNEKLLNMGKIKDRLLEVANLDTSLLISAIYTAEGQMFNFFTTHPDRLKLFFDPLPPETVEHLLSYNIDSQDKLSILTWYPLQPNRFSAGTVANPNPRQSNVLVGSKRSFNRLLGNYINTHIFIVPEQVLYDLYSPFLLEQQQEIFILGAGGNLISASDTAYLDGVPIPEEITGRLAENGSQSFTVRVNGAEQLVSYSRSAKTGWYTIIVTPAGVVTQDVVLLFRNMVLVLVLFILLFIMGIGVFSSHISVPLENMIQSMQHVEKGEFLQAAPNKYRNEIGQITHYYNHMVRRLERLIKEEYEKEKRSKELEVKVLMGQINPHFMYNTLETIVWKANQAKRPDIAQLASQLGHLLRLSVKSDSLTVPLEQEFQQAMLYIDIQRVRYKERLQFDIAPYDDALKQCMVIRLILQPSLENAIVHGMRPGSATLHIRVGVEATEDALILRIDDDGNGMDAQRLQQVRDILYSRQAPAQQPLETRGTGIGIRNIHERLVLYFGEEYGVILESREGQGTTTIIKMPRLPPEANTGNNTLA